MKKLELENDIYELYNIQNTLKKEIKSDNPEVDFIIEEIFSNIINYSGASYVHVKYQYDSDNILTLIFIDDGIKFNPLTAEAPEKPTNIEKVKIGGLGIHLTRQLADDMRYEYADDENHLTIIKRVK